MKSKKILLIIVLGIVIIVCWVMALRAVAGTEEREAQTALVEQADSFVEKELYVRAIPLYEEALGYVTEENTVIQKKLLTAYKEYGDETAWRKLIEKRISGVIAEPEEYFSLADYYRENNKLTNALDIIKNGMAQFGTEDFEKYYETYRYEIDTHTTSWSEIIPSADNQIMPAFDGQNWFYVNGEGKRLTKKNYQWASPYDKNGYAVVKYENEYITILKNGDWYSRAYDTITDVYAVNNTHILAQAEGKYSYYNYDFKNIAKGHQYDDITGNACGVAAVKKDDWWGIITDSGETVTDFVFEKVAVNSLGCVFSSNVAMVQNGGKWYLIDVSGNPVTKTTFADAKAPESKGYIAVANEEGKWGYIDHEGKLVIDYQYKDAKSFSDDLAAVKLIDSWGYISEKNELVLENIYAEAEPFHNGRAQVRLGDYMAILELKYKEE